MRSFDAWFKQPAVQETEQSISIDLLEHNDFPELPTKQGYTWEYPCVVCKEDSDICCNPEEFDPDMHYCGKDRWCCP